MIDDVQSEMPKDESIDAGRRWFVKGLVTGLTGLALTTAATSPAFARKRRRSGGGGGGGARAPKQPKSPGGRRRRGPH